MGVFRLRRALVLYCHAMNAERPMSARVLDWIQGSGLGGIAAAMLESFGPLGPLAAQLTYLLAPVLDSPGQGRMHDLASWLEHPEQFEQLAEELRKGGT
jgi:hypothetical protein